MNFIPLASSSAGNAYLLTSEGCAPLLIEAGISVRKLREQLWAQGVKLSDLSCCLVSHEHLDHSKAVKDLLKAGVDIVASKGTAKVLGIDQHHRFYDIAASMQTFTINEWRIYPVALEHDAVEPVGFFIYDGSETILFIPDTSFVRNRFSKVTLLAIECNNIEEILSRNIMKGNIPPSVGRRIRRSHMSLETVIKMLKANDLSKCRAVYLLHMSSGNSDEAAMIRKVQETVGVPVYACEQ
jgi:phosphoribosyl 1,2-cyclic phosphodiesterase